MTAVAPSQAEGLATKPASEPAPKGCPAWLETVVRSAMIGIAFLLVVSVSVRTIASWMTWGDIEHTSGTWIVMAADARDGMLYRPIVSAIGYGGTRYAPIHAILQADLLKLGMGYLSSGYLIEMISTIMLLWASWIVMRRLGATRANAFCFTCYILAGAGVNTTIGANKADLLAAALSLWGVVFLLPLLPWYTGGGLRWGRDESKSASETNNPHPGPPPEYGRGREKAPSRLIVARKIGRIPWPAVAAAMFFILAFDTKVTSIFGLAAGTIWLWRQGAKRVAGFVIILWILGIALSMAAFEWASDGRALAVFRACAAGGGGIVDFIRGPLLLAANALKFDKFTVYLWALAMVVLIGTARRQWASLAALLLIVTSLGTIAIFGTPGININHLIDINAAAMIFLAVQWRRLPARLVFSIFIMGLVCCESAACLHRAVELRKNSERAYITAALADADASPISGPLISENPLLPLLDGQRPYLLDSFMLRVINLSHPKLGEKFWDDLSHKRFRAVILTHPPTWTGFYNRTNFGPGFLEVLQDNYQLKSTHGDYYVLWPKK